MQRDRLDLVDDVLGTCNAALQGRTLDLGAEREIAVLLETTLAAYDVVTCIHLGHFLPVLGMLQLARKRDLSAAIIKRLLALDTHLRDLPTLQRLLDCVMPLLKDPDGESLYGSVDPARFDHDPEFADEQDLVCLLLHQIHGGSPSEHFAMLHLTHGYLLKGGAARMKRQVFWVHETFRAVMKQLATHHLRTLPALALRALAFARQQAQHLSTAAGPSLESALQFVLRVAEVRLRKETTSLPACARAPFVLLAESGWSS